MTFTSAKDRDKRDVARHTILEGSPHDCATGARFLTVEDLGVLVEVTSLVGATDAPRVAVGTRRLDVDAGKYELEVRVFEASAGVSDGGDWKLLVGPQPGSSPCLDRDGVRLATVEPAENGNRIVITELASGVSETVFIWPGSVSELVFSPDGTRLGFVAREHRNSSVPYADLASPPQVIRHLQYRFDGVGWIHNQPRHCFALDLASKTVSNLSGIAFDDHDLCWYDDELIVFVSRRHAQREFDNVSDLFLAETRANSKTEGTITTPDGGAFALTGGRRSWAGPVRDPRSDYLLATYAEVLDYPCHTRLSAIQPVTREVVDLSADHPWSLDGGQMLDARGLVVDGDSCVMPRAREGRVELVRVTGWRDGNARVELVAPRENEPATVKAVALAGDRLVASIASASRPVEVYEVTGDGALCSLTELNNECFFSRALAPTQYRQITAPDGTVLDSWVIRHVSEGKAMIPRSTPLLLYIQGGPTQFGWDFYFEFQYLAALGMAVLYCNPRGTTGYSEEWARTLCGSAAPHPGRGWGGYDLDDLVAVVSETLAGDESLDPVRVAAAGGSYGGILSTLMATKWDGLAAAVAERGVYNFALMAGTSDIGCYAFDTLLGLDAIRDRAAFDELSPLSFVDALNIPLLLLHSTDDRRCSIALAEEYFTAARRYGKDVTFVVFEGEGHELSRSGEVAHRLQRLVMIGEWLSARLDGRLAQFEQAVEDS